MPPVARGGEWLMPCRDRHVVAAVTSPGDVEHMDDATVVRLFMPELIDRYLAVFPPCLDLEPRDWVLWTNDSQRAVLCRAVADIERVTATFAVRHDGLRRSTELLWTPDTRAALHRAFSSLHRSVRAVVADLAETIRAFLSEPHVPLEANPRI